MGLKFGLSTIFFENVKHFVICRKCKQTEEVWACSIVSIIENYKNSILKDQFQRPKCDGSFHVFLSKTIQLYGKYIK